MNKKTKTKQKILISEKRTKKKRIINSTRKQTKENKKKKVPKHNKTTRGYNQKAIFGSREKTKQLDMRALKSDLARHLPSLSKKQKTKR